MRYLCRIMQLVALLSAILVVPACGKKGPLYLPSPPPPHAPPAKTTGN